MTIPTKTALGNEEIKSRTQRLGQRHRTILLLVDGRRSLAEVLSLAHQAGAATSHFEELVRLGLVELPPEPVAPAPEAAMPEETEAPELTSVQLDVPVQAIEQIAIAGEAERRPEPELAPQAEHAQPPPEPIPLPEPHPVPGPPVVVSAPVPPREIPVLAEEAVVDPLQSVRDLLVDALRFDAPLFSARMFMRVRNARTNAELINLVWEIQERLQRARHAQRELRSLQRARELLGLGNTLIADESRPPPREDENTS